MAAGGRKGNDGLNGLQLSEVAFENVADFENINTQEELSRANRMPVPARSNIEPGFSISAHSEGDQEAESARLQ